MFVKPKPHLGQHFLKNKALAYRIVSALKCTKECKLLIEIGAGTGILTQYLIQPHFPRLIALEIDDQSINYLKKNLDFGDNSLLKQDFLNYNLTDWNEPIGLIGNLPYRISGPIFFRIFEHMHCIKEVVCMVQKEVGLRITAPKNAKTRGLLSVLLQTYYDIEYLETIKPIHFAPSPKVDSALIHLVRNKRSKLAITNHFFKHIVKMSFAHRRKKLKNNLKPYLKILDNQQDKNLLDKRAEHLSIENFIYLSQKIRLNI